MTLWTEIASTRNSSGDEIILRKREDVYEIRYNGIELMTNLNHQSEEILAEKPILAAGPDVKRLFIGGLGMGFTLRASLDHLPADANIVVCELIPEIVAWNRTYFGHLTRYPLEDPRVSVLIGDALDALHQQCGTYDLILLDTDNGPDYTVREQNALIYECLGIHAIRRALKPGGIACFWSATRSSTFEAALDLASWPFKREQVNLSNTSADVEHYIYFVGDAFLQDTDQDTQERRRGSSPRLTVS